MRDEYQGITIYNNNVFSPRTELERPTLNQVHPSVGLFLIGMLAMPFIHFQAVIFFG